MRHCSRHHVTWRNNPQFKLKLKQPTVVIISLTQPMLPSRPAVNMGFYVALKSTQVRAPMHTRPSDLVP
jgi:hypothetical protein